MRRILFILILGLILAGVAFTLFNLERREGLSRSVYEAVSKESLVILDFKNPKSFFETLDENNLIFDEFKGLTQIAEMRAFQAALDSLTTEEGAVQLLNNTRLICSAQKLNDSLAWSFYLPILPAFSESELENQLLELSPEASSEELFVQLGSMAKLYIGIQDRILMVSKRKADIESALKNIEENRGIGKDSEFSRVFQSSGKNKRLNLYVQSKLAHAYFSKALLLEKEGLKPFGDWLELDLIIKPNSIQLDGLSQHNEICESSPSFNVKSYFSGIPKRITQLSTSALNFEIDSLGQDLLDSIELKFHIKWLEQLKSVTEKFSVDFEFYPGKEDSITKVSVLKVKDGTSFETFLNSHEKLDSTQFPGSISLRTEHALIWAIVLNRKNADTLLILKNDFLYFVPNERVAAKVLQSIENKRVLTKDEYFTHFAENMMTQGQSTKYWAPFRNCDFHSENNSDALNQLLSEYQSSIQKLEGLSWQYGSEGDKAKFHHLYLKYNPSIEEERNTLWEFEMKQKLAMKPQTFINHYSDAKEILVQDSSKTLYLLNNKGKLLWKRSLPDFILGDIHMVDKFKNKKFQMLFNTKNEVFLLDRKGRKVDDFQLKSKVGYSAPLQVLDYDDNKNYRILIPGKNGEVMNYTLDGTEVKGWKYEKGDYTMDAQIQFTQIQSKDFIVCHTSDGKFIALNRKGEVRMRFNQENMIGTEGTWLIEKASNLKNSFILASDSSGTFWKVHFKGENKKLADIQSGSILSIGNMDKDKYQEVFFSDENGMGYIDQGGSKEPILLSSKMCKALDATLTGSYAAILQLNGELLLLKNGQLVESESVLESNQLPMLQDLNADKELELVLGLGNQLFCFPLPN